MGGVVYAAFTNRGRVPTLGPATQGPTMTIARRTISGRFGVGGLANAVLTSALLTGGAAAVAQSTGAPFAGGAPSVVPAPAVSPPVAPPPIFVPTSVPVFVSQPVIQSLPVARPLPPVQPLPSNVGPVLRRDDPGPSAVGEPTGTGRRVERGSRLDPAYLDPAHTVSDTRAWGLPTAPIGLRWVRTWDDAALVDSDGVVREVRRGMDWERRFADAEPVFERTTARPGDRFYDPRCFGDGDPRDRSPLGPCPPDERVGADGGPVPVVRTRTIRGGTTVTTITTPAATVTTTVVEEYADGDPDE